MIITISPSSLDSLQECPTKYNFSTVKRLRLIEEDTSRLDRGTLYHKLLAMHYQLIINGINDESQKLEYPQVIAAVREFARGLGREDLFPLDMIEECIESYQDYAVYYANDGWTPIAVEAPFSKTFYEEEDLTIIMEGKIDLIARLEDMTFPVDHKTEEKKNVTIELSNQFIAYCWALESNNFCKNAIGFQKSYDTPRRLHRDTISYDDSIIEEWRENVIYDVMQLSRYIESEHFPKRYSSCRFCRYHEICRTTPDARNFKIESKFKVGEGYDIFGDNK